MQLRFENFHFILKRNLDDDKVEFSLTRYLGNDLTGSIPSSFVGCRGSDNEEVEEVIEELIGNDGVGGMASGSKGGDEGNDAVSRGKSPLEVE